MSKSDKLAQKFNEQSGKCAYCRHPMTLEKNMLASATRDHIVPRSGGGLTNRHNIVIACHRCNQVKTNMAVQEFLLKYEPHKFAAPYGRLGEVNIWDTIKPSSFTLP